MPSVPPRRDSLKWTVPSAVIDKTRDASRVSQRDLALQTSPQHQLKMADHSNTHESNEAVPMYGIKRKSKAAIPLSSSSIHALSTELEHAKALAASGQPRPSRPSASSSKRDIYKQPKKVNKPLRYASKPTISGVNCGAPTDEELARSKAALERKAKQYAKMSRRHKDDENLLVDFERKERDQDGDSSFEESSDDDDPFKGREGEPLVEYEDEFGRTRMVPRSWAEKQEKQRKEEEESSALPSMPESLIYGAAMQTHAFKTVSGATASELLDYLPPPDEHGGIKPKHYDANAEVRTKGVGFYAFSQDEQKRKEEMELLERERQKTEKEREEKEAKKRKRKEEIERRREEIKKKRAAGVSGKWLENMFEDLEKGKEPEKSGE